MTAGLSLSKAAIDNAAGSIARALNEAFDDVEKMNAWLAAQVDADLVSAYGYTSTDVANMKTAFADLDQLRQVYEGAATLAIAKNFRTFASRIWGLGFE